jgi:type VI secretion system protein ImpA
MAQQQDSDRQARILAPLPGETPAGEDLRLDATPQSLYYRLRDARAAARAAERANENDPAASDAESAHWRTVQDLAIQALQTHTKDIEIAAWLTESLTRHEGLAGLAEGAAMLAGLITQFWDAGLYPRPDAAEPEARLIAVSGLSGAERDGSLLQPVRKVVLMQRDDGTPVSFWLFERSKELSVLLASGQKPKGPAADVPAFADLEAVAQGRGRASLLGVGRDTVLALTAWLQLEAVVVRIVTADAAPSTGRLRGLLESLRRTVERYIPSSELIDAAPKLIEPQDSDTPQVGLTKPEEAASTPTPRPSATRDGMLDQVLQIAETFRRNEPNSPFGYTLEEAVRRVRLPWPDLLREMLPDPAPRSTVLAGFGLKPQPEDTPAPPPRSSRTPASKETP